jgi:protein AroM
MAMERTRAQAPAVLGAISIATSERDSLIEGLAEHLPSHVEIRPYGLLDGLDDEAVAALGPDPGEYGIVSHTASGREVLVAHKKILPGVCKLVEQAEADGVFATVVLCGAGWADVPRRRPLVDPGAVFPAIVRALAGSQRLGIIKPSAGQIEKEHARYTAWGHDVAVTSASPWAGGVEDFRRAGRYLRDQGAQLIWMTCVGFEEEYRYAVAEETGVPVVLARPLLGRVLAEVVTTAGVPVVAVA